MVGWSGCGDCVIDFDVVIVGLVVFYDQFRFGMLLVVGDEFEVVRWEVFVIVGGDHHLVGYFVDWFVVCVELLELCVDHVVGIVHVGDWL